MANSDRYDGYEAFEYLDASVDYEAFDLPDKIHHGEPYEVPLSHEEAERATHLSSENTVISLHDHPFFFPEDGSESLDYISTGRIATCYEGLAESNLTAVFDNMINDYGALVSDSGWKWDDTVYDIGLRLSDIAHQDFVRQCKSVEDIRQAHEEGTVALVPSLEASTMVENELDRIDILYGLGIRMMGLAFDNPNYVASGVMANNGNDGGLTPFGADAVERMNKLGMAIDMSHSSDQTILDVCEVTDDPVFLTHVGARELWATRRMKSDECIEAVADTGGVVGIAAASPLISSCNTEEQTVDTVMEHFEYVVDLVGIDHVSFGTDLIYGDQDEVYPQYFNDPRKIQHLYGSEKSGHGFDTVEEMVDIKGMENTTEAWHNIVRWLVKHGYSDEDVEKVVGGNALRVLAEVW